jgi:D-alanyl-lipoteichoic acid acyltransferase DltB (MBOAT superfamily)
MPFNSVQFGLFFLAVLGVLRLVPGAARLRVLLGASLLFYSLWIPRFLLLLLATLALNYALVRRMQRSANPRHYLIASIASTLGLLAIFKYSRLAYDTAFPLLERLFTHPPGPPELLLPLGISFYSFEIISLSVDVYRKRIECPSFGKYALFVTFFPHLIAGPIMRGNELLPQLDRGGEVTRDRSRRGLWLIASGLAKKAILADYLLSPFVNDVFAQPGAASGAAHLLAVYSFAFQIYFDFSGYTDMARGLACLLGFELPHNFLEPYLSRSAAEFWRRWHVSLSRWLRDYLYIPLGGNRDGRLRTGLNLLATMLLGGLWHGAGWNFAVWGGLHGLLLMAERMLSGRAVVADERLRLGHAPRVFLIFHIVCLIWVPFRAPTLAAAVAIWKALFTGAYTFGAWPTLQLVIVLCCAVLHGFERWIHAHLPELRARVGTAFWGPAAEGAAIGAIMTTAFVCSGAGAEFIYFQF